MPQYEVVPDWIYDDKLFAAYMESYPVQEEPFWKQPFPASWDVNPTEPQPPPPPAKGWSLSSLVGHAFRVFVDDMKFWEMR